VVHHYLQKEVSTHSQELSHPMVILQTHRSHCPHLILLTPQRELVGPIWEVHRTFNTHQCPAWAQQCWGLQLVPEVLNHFSVGEEHALASCLLQAVPLRTLWCRNEALPTPCISSGSHTHYSSEALQSKILQGLQHTTGALFCLKQVFLHRRLAEEANSPPCYCLDFQQISPN
jgi:hypothetical protein